MNFFFANVGIQPKLPKPPGFAKASKRDGITAGITFDIIRWNIGDLGFFDPMYDNKSVNTGSAIEHTGKNKYFRNVHLFIERIKKITLVKPIDLVRVNFWMNFRGTVFEWWTAELSDTEEKNEIWWWCWRMVYIIDI